LLHAPGWDHVYGNYGHITRNASPASVSLTDSVYFVEGFALRGPSAQAFRRRIWIDQECAAHQRRLVEGDCKDGEGVEDWRDFGSDSEDLSDESDISTWTEWDK
jgi:hypothetical protein